MVPPDFKEAGPRAYVDFILCEVLSGLKGEAAFVDIYWEQGAFSLDVARYYLEQVHHRGFVLKIHVEQLHDLGGGEMAVALGAVSIDHCDYLTPPVSRSTPRARP